MAFLEWDSNYSVHIEAIDKQHQVLVKWMNEFYDANEENDQVKTQQALEQLVKYTKLHFEDEERLMASIDYDDFENHKKSHEQLLSLVERLAGAYLKSPNSTTAGELSTFLKKWLINHILGVDKRYSAPAKAKGH